MNQYLIEIYIDSVDYESTETKRSSFFGENDMDALRELNKKMVYFSAKRGRIYKVIEDIERSS